VGRRLKRQGVLSCVDAMCRKALSLLLVTTALCGAGCATAPRAVQPPVAPSGTFSRTGAAPLPDRWWEHFADPQLNTLVDRALTNNFSLRAAWARLDQARAVAVRDAAGLRPSFTMSADAARVREHRETGTAASAAGTTDRTELSLGASAAYELDLWGGVRSARDAARLDAAAGAAELAAAAVTLSAETASAWYTLVARNAAAAVIEDQLRNNRDSLALLETRFRRGSVDASDVLQQRQLVESTRADLTRARADAAALALRLGVLLGADPTAFDPPAAANLVALPPLPATGVPAALVIRRPDVRAAALAVQAADRRAAAAVAERFPALRLTGQAVATGDALSTLFDAWLASIAAGLTAPLLDGGARRAEVDRTAAVVNERLNAYGQTVLTALGEVESALVRETMLRRELDSVDTQVALSEQVVERTRNSYLGGDTDYLRVLNARITQQTLVRSRIALRFELLNTRIALCRALAGGWDPYASNPDPERMEP
jgi:NodT family efflux transporter outer membrane factor (OMF) lipoprotein